MVWMMIRWVIVLLLRGMMVVMGITICSGVGGGFRFASLFFHFIKNSMGQHVAALIFLILDGMIGKPTGGGG